MTQLAPQHLNRAYNAGAQARADNVPFTGCPAQLSREMKLSWQNGWQCLDKHLGSGTTMPDINLDYLTLQKRCSDA